MLSLMKSAHLADCALMGFKLQHKVFMIVKPGLDSLEVFLTEAVHSHQMILGLQEPTEDLLEITAPRSEVTNLAVALPGVHDFGDRGDFSWLAPYCHHIRLSGALTTGLITCEEQVVSEGT